MGQRRTQGSERWYLTTKNNNLSSLMDTKPVRLLACQQHRQIGCRKAHGRSQLAIRQSIRMLPVRKPVPLRLTDLLMRVEAIWASLLSSIKTGTRSYSRWVVITILCRMRTLNKSLRLCKMKRSQTCTTWTTLTTLQFPSSASPPTFKTKATKRRPSRVLVMAWPTQEAVGLQPPAAITILHLGTSQLHLPSTPTTSPIIMLRLMPVHAKYKLRLAKTLYSASSPWMISRASETKSTLKSATRLTRTRQVKKRKSMVR